MTEMPKTNLCEASVTEQIQVMLKKETTVYLVCSCRQQNEQCQGPALANKLNQMSLGQCPQLVDTTFEGDNIRRLRMSDWSYSIVDLFGASRDIVAVAFNYLDRFLALERHSW